MSTRVPLTVRTPSFCWTALLMSLMGLAACGGDSMDPEVTVCSASTVSVTATVEVSETAPVFAWVPNCAVALVFVEGVTEGDVCGVSTLTAAGRAPLQDVFLSGVSTYKASAGE